MPRVQMSIADIGSRCEEVHALLHSIAREPATLHVQSSLHPSGGKIIAASDAYSANMPPNERRFLTKSGRLLGQYYEIWQLQPKSRYMHMTHAYFHLFYSSRRDEADYIFGLHTEPEHPVSEYAEQCKAGPHMHFVPNEIRLKPIVNSHFPLFLASIEGILRSKDDYDQAMLTAMSIVENEVLGQFVRSESM